MTYREFCTKNLSYNNIKTGKNAEMTEKIVKSTFFVRDFNIDF